MSSFIPSKFWVEGILFGWDLINFSIKFLNIRQKDELQINLVTSAGKKNIFKELVFTLKKGILLLRALREVYGLLFSGINLKGNQVICYEVLYKINVIFWTNALILRFATLVIEKASPTMPLLFPLLLLLQQYMLKGWKSLLKWLIKSGVVYYVAII